jgi:hypothetical protein
LGIGVGHVQSADKSTLEALPGYLRAVLLGCQVLAGNNNLLLKGTQVDEVAGHFGRKGHKDISMRFDGGLEIRVGGLKIAPLSTEKIDFPAGVEAGLVLIDSIRIGSVFA